MDENNTQFPDNNGENSAPMPAEEPTTNSTPAPGDTTPPAPEVQHTQPVQPQGVTDANTYTTPVQNPQTPVVGPGGVQSMPPKGKQQGLAIASLVLGIAAVVFFCIPFFGLILGAVGLILGIIAKVKGDKGLSIAGIILSAIGVLVGIIYTIMIFFSAFTSLKWYSNHNDYDDYSYRNGIRNELRLPNSFIY